MAQITSGSDLNSYRGDANLAGGGNNTGYAKLDFSPLETYALKKYEIHKIDNEQQQKDKADLEKMYLDPDTHVDLDKGLADQLQPVITRQKELSLMNLHKNPNSKEWFEYKDNYKKIALTIILSMMLGLMFALKNWETYLFISGAITIISFGLVLNHYKPKLTLIIEKPLNKIWHFFQMFLFILITAQLDLKSSNNGIIPWIILILIIGLTMRSFGVLLALIKKKWEKYCY